MKRVFAGLLGLICSIGMVASAQAAGKTIDLRDPVPAKIEINDGDSLVFEFGTGQVVAKDTDGKGELLKPTFHNTFNQNGAFRAVRTGEGEVTVTLASQGLATVITKKTIAVAVKAVHKVEFKKPYPATLTVNQGETIILFVAFKGDPGLYDPFVTPSAKTVDGKKGDVLEDAKTGVKRLDKDNIKVLELKALRAGDAEIEVKDINNKTVGTIKVTVK